MKWEGYSKRSNSWESEENLTKSLIKEFESKKITNIIGKIMITFRFIIPTIVIIHEFISAVRRNATGVNYLVDFEKQEPQIFTSSDMCAEWRMKTIKFLENLIEYFPGDDAKECGTVSYKTAKGRIGKPIRVLCKFYNFQKIKGYKLFR